MFVKSFNVFLWFGVWSLSKWLLFSNLFSFLSLCKMFGGNEIRSKEKGVFGVLSTLSWGFILVVRARWNRESAKFRLFYSILSKKLSVS